MSSGKANSGSLLTKIKQLKKNVRRSERQPTPNIRRYPDLEQGGGRGRGGGRGGGGGGGVDFDPPPSASGDVAPEFFLEGPSRDEAETESRDETETEEAGPKKLRTRGESRVPDERKEPKTHEAKTRIIPAQSE